MINNHEKKYSIYHHKQICYHNRRRIGLYIEPEVHDVTILYDVLAQASVEELHLQTYLVRTCHSRLQILVRLC